MAVLCLSYNEYFDDLLTVVFSCFGPAISEDVSRFGDEMGLSVQLPPSRDNCFSYFWIDQEKH